MTDKTYRVMWAEKPKELEVRHLPLKDVDDNDVLIHVGKAGICPWDLRAYSGLSSSVAFPRVLGHEMAGIVEAVGKNVKIIKPGMRVVPVGLLTMSAFRRRMCTLSRKPAPA